MRKALWTLLIGILAQQVAIAQPPAPPITQPTVSPYLNLSRRNNNSPAFNYFGVVRPQLEFRSAIHTLQQQSANNAFNAAQATDTQTGFPTTGHVAVFLNTGGYFMNNVAAHSGHSQLSTAQPRGPAAPAGLPGAVNSRGASASRR